MNQAEPTSATEHRGLITFALMLATVMQALDTTIANVALPYMQGSLSATQDQVNWVLTSYIVAAAIMTPVTGYLVGRLGRKRIFIGSIVGFTVSSMLCGMAQSIDQMVLFRLLQGVFGAPLVPISQMILLDSYPRERHTQAMAIWGMGIMVGPILGPTLGGWLTETFSWRYVFYINLPIGILAFLILSAYLRESRTRNSPFDWIGFLTFSLMIGALQMMLDRGQEQDWFSSGEIMLEAGLAVLSCYLFFVHSLTTEHPFIDLRMFRDRNLTLGLIAIFMIGMVLLASMALVTPYLQTMMGYPVVTAGIVMGPRGIGTMIAMMAVGKMAGKVDPRVIVLVGLALQSGVMWEMSGYTPDVEAFTVMRDGMIQGFGLGLVFVPLSTITFATTPPEFRITGASLFSLLRNLGSSIGVSIVIFLLTRNSRIAFAEMNDHVTPFNEALRSGAAGTYWNLGTSSGRALLAATMSKQAAIIAYLDDFLLVMMFAAVVVPIVFLLKAPPKAGGAPAPTVHAD
jgi:DHA2 family multidrug resistance protein